MLLLIAATTATLPPPYDPWSARPIAIATHRGAGTPTGRWGFSLDVAFGRRFSLLLGAGHNLEGGQLAAMPRLRFPVDTNLALGVSSGVSSGRYVWRNPAYFSRECWMYFWCPRDDVRKVFRSAWWWNVDASIEGRDREGLDVRFYGGVGVLLNPNAYECETTDPSATCSGRSGALVLYGGLSLGWSFGF